MNSLNLGGHLISVEKPIIMGILNLDDHSFYDGGQYNSEEKILNRIEKMIEEGADIIDIGAVSSRPFSSPKSLQEELDVFKTYFKTISKTFQNTFFSIDTFRSEVAEYTLDHGAVIINDISAFRIDANLPKIVEKYQAAYVLMHMQGMPNNMQTNPIYNNLLQEILYFFTEKLYQLNSFNISDIIIDLGFGFGKTIEDNYKLLKNISYFDYLEKIQLVGLSRKSMIYKPLNTTPENALIGTSALHFEVLKQGAKILRVHDVLEAKQVIDLYQIYKNVE
jgi:dihydropteroate synthase